MSLVLVTLDITTRLLEPVRSVVGTVVSPLQVLAEMPYLLADDIGEVASTQESLWMLLAAASDPHRALDNLNLGGAPLEGAIKRLNPPELGQSLENAGTGPVLVSVTATGVPDIPEPATSNGYRIERFAVPAIRR